MGFDSATMTQVQNGSYTAWDCPNQWYEVQQINPGSFYVQVEFQGIYNMQMLAAEYATFPGVSYAEHNGMFGGGSTICGSIDGDTWHMVLLHGWGDCPSGCIYREYFYFTTTSTGAPVFQDSWLNSSGTPEPAWRAIYGGC